jgi:fibronectin-binding autotransporter adhesin
MKINLTKRLLRNTAAKLIAAFLMSGGVQESQAVVFLWNNTGTAWTSGTSWTNGVQPSSTSSSTTTDDIQFSNYGASNNTVILTSTRAAASMAFLTNANAYTINSSTGAQTLSISKGLTNNSTATQTFNILLENANANNTWYQTSGGSLVFNNNVGLTTASSSTARTLTLAGGGTFTFNAGITQGLSTGGKLSINNAGGIVNLNAANTMGGGTVISAGTVNISNSQALGTGIVELGATTGTTYGNSILNNTKGSALTLTGLTGVLWSGTTPAGIQIGTSSSTAANNIDFGNGLVTTTTSRQMNIAGTGVTISMGTLTTTGTGNGYTFQFDGTGNTIDLDGWKISTAPTPIQNVVHQLKGTANLTMGIIENGTAGWVNGIEVNGGGVNRFTGNNTYTGTTSFLNGSNIVTGNNSAATGAVSIAGTSGSGKMPYLRLDNINGISSSSIISGSTSTSTTGTIDFNGGTNYVFNSYGGNNMFFTNSYNQAATVTFTNAANTVTSSAAGSGGRQLINNSTNLTIVFNGNVDIGSTSTGLSDTFGGAGDWNIKGGASSTTVGSVRGLNKTGTGKLTLEGASSYNGDTTISGGTLLVTAGSSITGSTAQLSGGLLDARGTIGDVVQNGGVFDLRGTAGTFTIFTGTANVFSGGILGSSSLNGGTLLDSGSIGNTVVGVSSTLDIKSGGTASKVTANGGTLLISGSTLQTEVNSGTAIVNTGGNGGSTTINGSTLDVYGTIAANTINTGGRLNIKTGGTATGTSTVGGGTLLVEGTVGTVVVNSGTATVNSGGTIGSTTINGSLLSVNGSAGDVLVNTGGTLGGSGSVQGLTLNGGTVAPGNSPGLLTAYELNGSNGTFQFQLGASTTRGITYDAINVTSLLTLGANTAFTFETLDNYTYADGNTYDLFDWGSADMSTFDVAVLEAALPNLNTPSTDLKWNVSNFTTDGTIGVIPEPSTGSLMMFGIASLITLKAIRRKKCQHQNHS